MSFRLETFQALAARGEEVDWIVENFISSGGWTYLVGEAGSGKSTLMITLCDALQSGGSFLGMACKKRNCLYIQVDTGMLEWQKQVRAVTQDSQVWTMYAMDSNFLDTPKFVDDLRRIVWGDYPEDKDSPIYRKLKKQKFDFIVFDVLNRMTSYDLNTKPGMSHVLNQLETITARGNGEERESVHFILLHHPNATTTRGVTAGSGYKGFGGLCGTMLTLKSSLLVLEKSKVTSRKEILLVQNKSTGGWNVATDYKKKDIPYETVVSKNGFSKMCDETTINRILGA